MNIINPRSLIKVLCLAIVPWTGLGLIFMEPSQAQSAVYNFQTTIDGECSFSDITGGTLALSADKQEFISDTPATATLTCNATNLVLTLNPPEVSAVSAPFTITSSTATATYRENDPFAFFFFGTQETGNLITLTANQTSPSSRTYTGLTAGSSVLRIAGSRTLTVNMSARSNTVVSAGLYLFTVRFSAIPN